MPTPRAGYFLADGTKVPGVTTILSRWKDSGGLLQWAFKQGQSGARTLYEERDKAADIGTLAHSMVEHRLTGRDPANALAGQPEDYCVKARTAYAAFDAWMSQTQAKVISAEEPMVSERYKFGGTPDVVLRMPDGRLALGDVKTSNGIYRDYLMQVAAYGILWDENHEEKITGGFHIMRFSKEAPDFEHRYFAELSEAALLFTTLRDAYSLDLQLKKRCA
mgnify:CR=1 FL=1